MLVLVLLALDTWAVAERYLPLIGVTTKVTGEMEPACSVGIWQTTALLLGALQVPEPAVALMKVTPAGTVPFTAISSPGPARCWPP